MFDHLLDSIIDLTGDIDDGVLFDHIFFGLFSQSYTSPFNKTSRLGSLDGFNSKTLETYNINFFSRSYIYVYYTYVHFEILLLCVCDSSRVSVSRGVLLVYQYGANCVDEKQNTNDGLLLGHGHALDLLKR